MYKQNRVIPFSNGQSLLHTENFYFYLIFLEIFILCENAIQTKYSVKVKKIIKKSMFFFKKKYFFFEILKINFYF